MKQRQKKAMRKTIFLFVTLCSILVFISIVSETRDQHHVSEEKEEKIDRPSISDDVLKYESQIEKYAEKYNVEAYKDVLMAIMMQESGGRGDDPMQASESYCGEIDCIEDRETSIKHGVHIFADTLDQADGDVRLAVQSYNFGKGFIDYVEDKSGSYTQDKAINFSKKMYKDAPDRSDYTCLREEAEQHDACYGDIYYVRDVMKYRNVIEKL